MYFLIVCFIIYHDHFSHELWVLLEHNAWFFKTVLELYLSLPVVNLHTQNLPSWGQATLTDSPAKPFLHFLDFGWKRLHKSSKIFVEHALYVVRRQFRPQSQALRLVQRAQLLFRSQEWPTSIFSQQHQQIIKSKGYENYEIDYHRENAMILNQILSTMKCMKIGLENLYVDLGL